MTRKQFKVDYRSVFCALEVDGSARILSGSSSQHEICHVVATRSQEQVQRRRRGGTREAAAGHLAARSAGRRCRLGRALQAAPRPKVGSTGSPDQDCPSEIRSRRLDVRRFLRLGYCEYLPDERGYNDMIFLTFRATEPGFRLNHIEKVGIF